MPSCNFHYRAFIFPANIICVFWVQEKYTKQEQYYLNYYILYCPWKVKSEYLDIEKKYLLFTHSIRYFYGFKSKIKKKNVLEKINLHTNLEKENIMFWFLLQGWYVWSRNMTLWNIRKSKTIITIFSIGEHDF